MSQLQRRLKTLKTMMTKNMNKMEAAIPAFKKVGSEGGSATRLKMKAEEIVEVLDKLKEEKKEMDSISASLKRVMCESEPDELGNGVTQDIAIEKLDDDIENYLEDNDKAIATAIERSLQVITSVTSVTVEQPTQSQDKFTCYSDIKPNYLEKESNLLEVKSWTRQAENYITADYKSSPPKKEYIST